MAEEKGIFKTGGPEKFPAGKKGKTSVAPRIAALLILMLTAVVISGFLYFTTYGDPVRNDLKKYLETLETTKERFKIYPITGQYFLKVLGIADPAMIEQLSQEYVSSGLPLAEARRRAVDESEKFAKRASKRTSIKEQYKILSEYHSLMLEYYRNLVPVTGGVESVHNHLLRAIEYKYKEENITYDAIDLDKFLTIAKTENGKVRVTYYSNKNVEKMNESIDAFHDQSDKEKAMFKKELAKLVKIKGLEEQYNKIFPDGVDVF